jgi:uncharacterized membrane protein YgcG
VSFQESAKNSEVIIPQYNATSNVIKLYDNLFIDPVNANIIEVDSTKFTNGGAVDTTGVTISNIYIITRTTGLVKNYVSVGGGTTVTPVNTAESLVTTVTPSGNPWNYITKCVNTDTYQLFYVPCGTSTYITIINLTKSTQLKPYVIMSFVVNSESSLIGYEFNNTITLKTLVNPTDGATTNTISKLTSKTTTQQIGTQTYFDTTNHNLILVSPQYLTNSPLGDTINGGVIIKRASRGKSIPYTETDVGITSPLYSEYVFVTSSDKELIICFPIEGNTHILLIIPDINNNITNAFKIENTVSYGQSGPLVCNAPTQPGTATTPPPAKPDEPPAAEKTTTEEPPEKKTDSPTNNDFYKWYYWVSMSSNNGTGIDTGSNNTNSNLCKSCGNAGCANCYNKNGGGNGNGNGNGNGGGMGGGGGNGGGGMGGGGYYDSNGNNLGNNIGNNIGGAVGGTISGALTPVAQGVQYGVNEAGQAVRYGVNEAGNGVEYLVDKTGSFLNTTVNHIGTFLDTAVDDIGNVGKYLIERGDNGGNNGGGYYNNPNGSYYNNQNGGNYNNRNGSYYNNQNGMTMSRNQPPNSLETPQIYSNQNGPVTPTFLPITADFSAFGR